MPSGLTALCLTLFCLLRNLPALLRATCKVSPYPETMSPSAWSSRRPGNLPLTPHLPVYAPSYPLQVCLHMPGSSTCRFLHLAWPKRYREAS